MQVQKVRSRAEFRAWLQENADKEKECWVVLKRGKPTSDGAFYYLDAVEEALCFGWIDSTQKKVDGVIYQWFSPRKKGGFWSELNVARAHRLERLGLMTDAGREAFAGAKPFEGDADVESALKEAGVWETFCTFPPLYRRIRIYNVAFYKKRAPETYKKALKNLIENTKEGKLYGEWNDYGRLNENEEIWEIRE